MPKGSPEIPTSGVPRLGVLLSGGGRSLENLVAVIERGELRAETALVISNTPRAYGLVRAARHGIETRVLAPRDFESRHAWGVAIYEALREARVDCACLMGFLSLLPIADDFVGRVVNIHPSLLPAFGGKGMYGHHVHEAVLAAGESESGCTVHLCDEVYDRGRILVQRRCPVLPDDTPERLALRVFEEEKLAYPEALRRLFGQH